MTSATTSHTRPRVRSGATAVARAYGGPAHGQCWPIADDDPPDELDVAPDSPIYRLIHHPGTHEPAKDHLGNYLYMPVSPQADGHDRVRRLLER